MVPDPGVPDSGSPAYYSFDYGNVHYAMVSLEDQFEQQMHPGGAQRLWLEKDLLVANLTRWRTPWIVVALHRPLYCSYDSSRCDDDAVKFRALLENMLYKYGVDFVLTGHNHMYEREYPVYQGEPILPSRTADGVDYFENPKFPIYAVVGTAGKSLSSSFDDSPPWNACQKSQHGYAQVTTTETTFAFRFRGVDGETVDAFTIERA